MCEANAYIEKDGQEELYLENVDILKPEEGKIYMKNLFGEQKFFVSLGITYQQENHR